MTFTEPLEGLFKSSKRVILDLRQIPSNLPVEENIQLFFEELLEQGLDPRLPENKQKFNNNMIKSSGFKYLIGNYGEDRKMMLDGSQIAAEGRTIHMGIDIFAVNLEPVYSPCNGEIIKTGYEKQIHGYGYYVIIKTSGIENLYLFFGHLGKDLPAIGEVKAGQRIARLGDYKNNENGGWSRHLHLQVLTSLPPDGETPIGYSSEENFVLNSHKYPNPRKYFTRIRAELKS